MRAKNTKFCSSSLSFLSLSRLYFSFQLRVAKIYFDASQQSCNARVKVECKVKPTRSGNILFALLSKKKEKLHIRPVVQ